MAEAGLLTIAEAAEYLTVHPDTVRRLLDRGQLTRVRVGRVVRIQRAELDAYVRGGGDTPATPKPPTPEAIRALHAKSRQLDDGLGCDHGASKAVVLEKATARFGRPITSASDLSAVELDWVLDVLAADIANLPTQR